MSGRSGAGVVGACNNPAFIGRYIDRLNLRGSIVTMFYRIVPDTHREFWLELHEKARKLADLRVPRKDSDKDALLLLPGMTGSHRRWNVYRWVVERYSERVLAVYDVPGNHYGCGGTDWDTCESPAPALGNYRFGATLADDRLTAATLLADFKRGNPIVEERCRVGINDSARSSGSRLRG